MTNDEIKLEYRTAFYGSNLDIYPCQYVIEEEDIDKALDAARADERAKVMVEMKEAQDKILGK